MSALDRAIAERKPTGTWYRTGCRNEAFTLAFGHFCKDVSGGDDNLPCCWQELISYLGPDGHLSATEQSAKEGEDEGEDEDEGEEELVFEGEFFTTIHSNNYSQQTHQFMVTKDGCIKGASYEEAYTESERQLMKDTSLEPEAVKVARELWATYLSESTPIETAMLASTYYQFISAETLEQIRVRHFSHIKNGKWYYLPSDCYCCS